jgi:hypothetical protein
MGTVGALRRSDKLREPAMFLNIFLGGTRNLFDGRETGSRDPKCRQP